MLTRFCISKFLTKKCTVLYGLIAIVIVSYLIYTVQISRIEKQFYSNFYLRYQRNFPNETACIIPHVDPFDPSVSQYIYSVEPLICGGKQPYLTFVDIDGNLSINETELRQLKGHVTNLKCQFSEVWLQDDNTLAYGEPKTLQPTQKLRTDVVHVKCQEGNGWLIYENVHTYIKLPSIGMNKQANPYKQRPSVFLLAIDSMSRANFVRQLPKTFKYLSQDLGAIVFDGLTKVGDNTFPNIIPMLTGLRVSYREERHELPVLYREMGKKTMDILPLIWKTFRKEGYTTMYAEDMPQFALFNYITKGFVQPPVDHYMRPFWMASENSSIYSQRHLFCFGNYAKHTLILKYAKELALKYKYRRPFFSFAFISEISHDYLNQVQVIDDELTEYLNDLDNRGIFENAILIVMGDHGNRFDKIRSTVVGRLEERLPFFSIRIPPWLDKKYPHIKKILNINSHRLTSWFDVHEMLKDVNYNDFTIGSRKPGRHGISLFREISPVTRTCEDAGVVEEYCTCNQEQMLSTSDLQVQNLGLSLVSFMNQLLEPFLENCVELELKDIRSATVILPSRAVAIPQGLTVSFRIVVEVLPSGGLIEGLLRRDAFGNVDVVGDLVRINKYGNESACIRHGVLRNFCYCRSLMNARN